MPRPILTADDKKCNACGQYILDCAEITLAIILRYYLIISTYPIFLDKKYNII